MTQGIKDPSTFISPRICLRPLQPGDEAFVLHLLNTPGWISFIGDRHIHTIKDAERYISTVLSNPKLQYQVVCLLPDLQLLGIITVIERDYLPGPDLGFAFLPEHTGHGYAQEASEAMIAILRDTYDEIYAVTVPWNYSSAKLLKRLGFVFQKELSHDHEMLNVYLLGNLKTPATSANPAIFNP